MWGWFHNCNRRCKEEKPTANKLIEKKGASPKVADDTAAYIIPFN